MYQLILIAIIMFMAGFVQGISGFGSALLAMSLLPLIVDLHFAVPLVALTSIVISLVNISKTRKNVPKRQIGMVILGSAIGIPVGVLVLKKFDSQLLCAFFGLFLIAFSIYFMLGLKITQKSSRRSFEILAGLIAGICGGAFNLNGPPLVIYSSLYLHDKRTVKAFLAACFIISGIIINITLGINGFFTMEVFKAFVITAPVTVVGVLIGHYFFEKTNHNVFRKITCIILIITGLMLLLK